MSKMYDGTAEEAANFYVTLLSDSRIEVVNRSPIDTEEAANSIAVLQPADTSLLFCRIFGSNKRRSEAT